MKKSVLLAFCLLLFAANQSQAQTLTRGPYLQMPNESSIVIRWDTDIANSSKVWFGTSPSAMTDSVSSSQSQTRHEIRLTGLSSNTKYYYKVGETGGVLAESPHQFFRTHPSVGSTDPFRFWVIGDFGKNNQGQRQALNAFLDYNETGETQGWLWMGDNAYDIGTQTEFQDKVFNVYDSVFNYLPFWPCPGNHDYSSCSHTLGQVDQYSGPYYDIVTVPQNGECGGLASDLECFYSFDYGNAHFISLNSELYYAAFWNGFDEMKDWLRDDLAANSLPWVIVYFHQPPYSKGSHDSDAFWELIMIDMREDFNPIFEQYGVDLVLGGHSHVYERFYPLKGHYGESTTLQPSMIGDTTDGNPDNGNRYLSYADAQCPDLGTMYIVMGNSGSDTDTSGNILTHPAMIYGDGGDGVYGSMMLEFSGDTLTGKYLKADGTIPDKFQIVKIDSCNQVTAIDLQEELALKISHDSQSRLLKVNATFIGQFDQLQLLDMSGRLLAEQEVSPLQGEALLSTQNLAVGVYLISILKEGKQVYSKLIKIE